MKVRVLVVDDEDTIRKLLKSRLDREGHDVSAVGNADEAEEQFEKGAEIGVMITDLKMPGRDGFQLMEALSEKYPLLRVIVITGHGEKEAAVKALRYGAAEYLEKPFDLDEIGHAVKRALREYQLEAENRDLVARLEARAERAEHKTEEKAGWFISKSNAMNKVNEWLTILRRESFRGDAEEPSVLIQGASGTGKEGVARNIHQGSRRAKGPWIAVNCANFSEQLLESELFGHEKGAFTGANALKRGLFELAKGGTLLLDEIGEMEIKLQAKLLRVLQEKVFRRVGGTQDLQSDVRIVAATNRDLQAKLNEGIFREDLYHRLCRVVIELPSLRERKEDIVPMAAQFAEYGFRSRGKTFGGFTPDGEEGLRNYSWPGNVREMLNVIERTALVWEGSGPISFKHLGLPQSALKPFQTAQDAGGNGSQLQLVTPSFNGSGNGESDESYMTLKKKWGDSFEREYLVAALQRHGGNVSSAAREAKLDRSNFLRLLRRHGLKATEYRKAA